MYPIIEAALLQNCYKIVAQVTLHDDKHLTTR